MKLSQLKEEIKQVLRERTVIAIQKEYQKTVEEIGKALELYKQNKLTDKKNEFVKVLKQLGDKKKSLERELDMKVQSMYRDAEYKNLNTRDESVNESSFVKGKTYGGTKCEGGCFVGKQGLMKIIKISKELPNNTFIFRQDNFSGLQPHFIKNGVIAIAKTINPSYDLERNKVRNLNIGKDVILAVQLFD